MIKSVNFSQATLNTDYIYAMLMLFYGMMGVNPFLAYVGFRGIYSALIVILTIAVIVVINNKKISIKLILILFLSLIAASISAAYWTEIRNIFFPGFFLVSLLLIYFARDSAISKFCTASTVFVLCTVIGAVIAFFIAKAGVNPLFSFPNPNGGLNYFFYTSFTNSYFGNFIRPSGLFDEPGTLSFFICFVAAMRHLSDRNKKITWFILILGFITFSLAHLVYVFFHLIAEKWSIKKTFYLISIVPFILATAEFTDLSTDINEQLIVRLATDDSDSGRIIAGDNRSWKMTNAWDQMTTDSKVLFFGADNNCLSEQNESICKENKQDMGENLFSPLIFGGLLIAWPYYILLIFFLITPLFGRKYLVVFGIGLLFTQRPYIMGISYSLAAILIAYFTMRLLKNPCIESGSGKTGQVHK